jgi:hypothetical protein
LTRCPTQALTAIKILSSIWFSFYFKLVNLF